ncbi:hypothetical protein [Sphaerisporangium corydalis]|uniref:Uncharacterized protein n=1 Tax=Sphaerisporangium corydalis TaxID=1441875 RepID=A0ABV9ENX0_9ACTN|nr:hypothetical protein [Sphaerisporangium corydalis]
MATLLASTHLTTCEPIRTAEVVVLALNALGPLSEPTTGQNERPGPEAGTGPGDLPGLYERSARTCGTPVPVWSAEPRR